MTRTGASKPADAGFALGRLRKAIAFEAAAGLAFEHLDRVRDTAPVSSNAILAAIAYADALTAAYGGRVNQQDHAAVVKLLRDALGKALPTAQERRLDRLLGHKDEVQYGVRVGRSDDAEQTIEALEAFGSWARALLAARSVSITAADEGSSSD